MELEVVLPDESARMPASALVDLARAAEDLGYSTAWLPDHVLPPGEYGPTFGGVHEPLVSIAHLAAHTDRLRFGTSVLVAPLRDPFVLAKQSATVQQLSGGRLVLGLGVGWSREEFDAVGADFARRGAVTDDVIALLRHLFSGGAAPYEGRRFSYDQGVFAPVPEQPIPIMVGGNSDVALRRAARSADIWQGLPDSPDAYAERVHRLREFATGRDVTPAVRVAWDGSIPVGDVVAEVGGYRDAGASRLAVHFGDADGTMERMRSLARVIA